MKKEIGDARTSGIVRQYAPAKTPIETRHDESGDKQEAAELHDRLLLLLFFLGIQPLSKQVLILGHHNQAGAEHRHKQNPDQQPALPIIQRPRGQKQEQTDEDKSS